MNYRYCTTCKNAKAHPKSNQCRECFNDKVRQEHIAWAEFNKGKIRNIKAKTIYTKASELPRWMKEHMEWGS